MPDNTRSVARRYGFAAVCVALATWTRRLLDPALGTQFPFATLFFAILLAAWYGGFGPALAAVVLGAFSAAYFIMPPRGTFAIESWDQRLGMALYLSTSLGIAVLGGLMHAAWKKAEASSQAERRQSALIDETYDAVLVWEWNGPITFWNRGAERLYGFPREEALGRVSHDLLHAKTAGGVGGLISALERESFWEGELEHTTRDGKRSPWKRRMVLVREAERPYVLEANRDITARLKMEAELRDAKERLESRVRERTAELARTNESLQASEERFRFLIEGVQDYAIFMLDLEGHVVTWNAGAERSKGYRAEEIIGRHFTCFYPEEEIARGKPERELQTALAEGRCEDIGWRVRKNGSQFWAKVVITPLYDELGQPRGFSKVTRDITEGKQAEERFRQAVESAPNGMVMIDSAGKIVLVNAQTERLFGYHRDEMLGQPVEKLVPERFRGHHPMHRSSYFAEPQVRPMGVGRDLYGRRKDGSEFPVEIGLNPIETEVGLLVLSAIVDITERKQAEDALKETDARLKLFITHAPAALAMFDRDMRYLAASRRWLSDYGLDDAIILGRSHYEIMPEIPERWKAIHRRGLDGEVIQADAERFERADGSVQWLRWEVRPWPAADGVVGGIVLFTEDISERKRAEEASSQLAEIVKFSHDAIIGKDLNSIVTSWNAGAEKIFGYSASEMIGCPITRLIPADRQHEEEHILARIRNGESVEHFDTLRATQDGRAIDVSVTVSPIKDATGEIIGASKVAHDITERKRVEEALRERRRSFTSPIAGWQRSCME